VDVATAVTNDNAVSAVTNDDAVSAIVLPSLTEDEGAYIGASVAFKGVCVSMFADGEGQLSEDDDVESAAGKVGHEDHGPR